MPQGPSAGPCARDCGLIPLCSGCPNCPTCRPPARLYADKHGIGTACLRIDSFRERPEDTRPLTTWISPRDLLQLAPCCFKAPDYRYLVLYSVSVNTRSRRDNPQAAQIRHAPQDNAEI